MEARKNCSYLFEDGRGKNCPKTFLGSPLKTKTMAINFGILKLISYSYCKSHCTTKYGFTVLFLKKIILSWWRHQSLSNVMIDLGKNDVMFQWRCLYKRSRFCVSACLLMWVIWQKIVDSQSSETVLDDVQSKIRAKYNYKNHCKSLLKKLQTFTELFSIQYFK